STTTT
ncbi:AAA domain family protein, partial [Vibrio parahaemolyticus V-223/04]